MSLKLFQQREIFAAYAHVEAGGQALHLHTFLTPTAPSSFRREVEGGGQIGHLLDQDLQRLITTALSLGVLRIHIEHRGTRRQHIDLCGEPLQRALRRCAGMPVLGEGRHEWRTQGP